MIVRYWSGIAWMVSDLYSSTTSDTLVAAVWTYEASRMNERRVCLRSLGARTKEKRTRGRG